MSFLLNFFRKKMPACRLQFRFSSPNLRRFWSLLWLAACLCSTPVESSWDVCQMRSFSCEENAGSKKTRLEKAMGIYSREKKNLMKLLGHLSKHDPRLYALEMGNSENDFCGRKNNSKFEVQKASCFYTGKIVSSQRIYTKIAPKPDVFDVLWKEWFQKDLHPEVYQRGKTPEAAMVVGRWSFPIGLKVTFQGLC